MKRDVKVYVQDILESIKKIEEYRKGLSEKEFLENTQIQDAILRRLEVIGEAVKGISDEVRNAYPEIPWKQIAGMRDVLIHGYFGVNLERVWEVLQKDLPGLKNKLLKVQKNLKNSS